MSMNRRDFFRVGLQNAAKLAGQAAADRLGLSDRNLIRPPYAVAEAAFLEACTRCDACIEACSYDVLFKLPEEAGAKRAATPVMDLLVSGCHLCGDWPCVTVCEPRALQLPASQGKQPPEPPKLARAAIDTGACLPYAGPECGACADACPVPGALNWVDGVKPVIDEDICTGCALCREFCITDPKAIEITEIQVSLPADA
ncbi:MAG: 4Fe-4S dicluster domain-containing protein [Rhodospirillales bacterium]|jgi:ferredoxin-type protein NapG|nr:4Fe-4S dicluster domain-containing protein [Rhodospirillales bacterium]|tara:strand:+ start:734 stop:1333 length:600 start_codon:yes stop_codon:yes gene_type:complete